VKLTECIARQIWRQPLPQILPAVLAVLVLAACTRVPPPTAPSGTAQSAIGNAFHLRVSQKAVIPAEGLEFTFLKVTEDSRCPTGAGCVWPGQTVIQLAVSQSGQPVGTFPVSSFEPEGQKDRPLFTGYHVSLVGVSPERQMRAGGELKPIDPAEYEVALLVTRTN
jgi:hypothetical protein